MFFLDVAVYVDAVYLDTETRPTLTPCRGVKIIAVL
jgi:hypothetical protein